MTNNDNPDGIFTEIPAELIEKWKTDAPMFAPHHCRFCGEDKFRLIDWRPLYKLGWFGRVLDVKRVMYFWECKVCRMRQVVTADFE